MRKLGRDEILSIDDKKIVTVEVPEWNGEVTIRTLTARQRDNLEIWLRDKKPDLRARIVVSVVCDEAGNPVFSEADVPALSEKNGDAVQRIFDAVMDSNFVTKEAMDELEKN